MKEKKISFLISMSLLIIATLLVMISLGISYENSPEDMYNQKVANRWKGDNSEDYVQNTVFISVNNQLTKDDMERDIEEIKTRVEQEIGVPVVRNSVFAFSGQTKVQTTSEHKSINVNAIGVGADYFFFHPLKLVRGNYLDKNDLRQKVVLLDEIAAWELFGSSDIVGKKLNIDETHFTVVGVVCINDIEKKLNDDYGSIYLDFGQAQKISDVKIGNIETVLPKKPEGYALEMLNQRYNSEESLIITNTNRFSVNSIFQKILTPQKFIVHDKAIALPSYENAARLLEYKLIQKLQTILFVTGLFIIEIVILAVRMNRFRVKIGSKECAINVRNCFKKHYKNLRQKCRSYKRFESENKG